MAAKDFLPDFEANSPGRYENRRRKEFEITFPDNYGNSALASKVAVFKVNLKGIQVKADVTIDEEAAKKMMPEDHEATLEKLTAYY